MSLGPHPPRLLKIFGHPMGSSAQFAHGSYQRLWPWPTTLAMAIEKNDSLKTRMVVVGDSDFASDVYVSQAPGNMDFFLNIVSWLAEEEDLIAVRPKEPENRTISLTMKQQNLVLFFLIILLPLVSVRIGIHIYMRRS